ncbi:MAG: O-antigen ligase family protein [Sphingorhabdus sp.]
MLSFLKGFKANQPLSAWLSPAWLWLCLILGGASQGGVLANITLQGGAACIIAYWLWSDGRLRLQRADYAPLVILAAALLWIIIMFIPLPPALWQSLPGREFVTRGYRLLDIPPPWLSMAMAPDRALRSVLGLLAPIAAFFLARRMDDAQARRMVTGIIVIAALSAALGLAQQATGQQSILRFYLPTNRDVPVGLFANTNHFSLFLACSLPFAAAWVATLDSKKPMKRKYLIGLAIFAAFLALVLVVGRSLAGLAFLILSLTGATYIVWGRSASGRAKMLFLTGVAVAAIATLSSLTAIGTGTIGAKFEDAPNSRANMTPVTATAGMEMAPTGSGLGSFTQVYAMHQPDRYTSTTWVNHAHNDYAELFLELGIPGLILIAAFLIWFVRAGFQIWQRRADPDTLMAQAAWLSIALMLMHSLVDYPLRTGAMAGFFAVAVALMCRSLLVEPKSPI